MAAFCFFGKYGWRFSQNSLLQNISDGSRHSKYFFRFINYRFFCFFYFFTNSGVLFWKYNRFSKYDIFMIFRKFLSTIWCIILYGTWKLSMMMIIKAYSLYFLNPRYINSFAFGFVKVVLNIDRKSLWKSDRLVKKVSVS